MKMPIIFLSLALLLFVGLPGLSQEESDIQDFTPTPNGYAPLWIEKSATVTPEAIQTTLAELARQEDDPEAIIVFIHGFKKPREGSTRDFNALAERVRAQFDQSSTRVGLVGVQWDSATTVKKSSGLDALRMIRAYHETVPLARSVGRGPIRELLLALQKKYPKAHLNVFAHSMGCEAATAALMPEINYEDHVPQATTYRPDEDVQLDLLVLAGSDLDYDFWYKSGISARELESRTRLTWLTVSDYLSKGDKVLNTRKRIRGRAGGNSFPRMTLEQLDQSVSERRIFIDHRGIPRNHQFLDYYEDSRLNRILATLDYLTVPRAPQPDELAELDEIIAAPNDLKTLLGYLDRPNYSSKFYALWRLERINCGDARHMTDLTLDEIVEMLRQNPQKITEMRAGSECITVRKGQFPSEKAMREAGVTF